MDSFSTPSLSEQAGQNSIKEKLMFPPFYGVKAARQPNPIIHRKLRRRSAVARTGGKQFEYPTNKELLRTIAYLRNATEVFYGPQKVLPYDKAYFNGEDDEEGITDNDDEEQNSMPKDENGKQELPTSIKSTEKACHILETKMQQKKSSTLIHDEENKKCGNYFSFSHVLKINDKHESFEEEHGQGLATKLQKSASTLKAFIQFCSSELIGPHEHRATLAVKLCGVHAALLSALGSPFEIKSQSISSSNSSQILLLNLGQASTRFLPAMIWTGMFILSFVYTVMVVWSLAFRVPIVSMLFLALLYCLSVLVQTASGVHVICGTFRMRGILFASLGVLGLVLLLVVLAMLVLLASWRCTKQGKEEAK